MAVIKKDGGYMPLPISIKRGNPIPLDASSIWYDAALMNEYAQTNVTAYVGQILVHVDESANTAKVYVIANSAGDLTPVGEGAGGAAINVDDNTVELNDEGLLKLKDFGSKYYRYVAAQKDENGVETTPATYVLQEVNEDYPWKSGLIPQVVADPNDPTNFIIGWYEPNPTTIEGVNTAVSALQNELTAVKANLLQNYYTKTELAGALTYKGAKDSLADIEVITNATVGDIYVAKDSKIEYIWNGTDWDALGNTVDLSQYVTQAEIGTLTNDVKVLSTTVSTLDTSISSLQSVQSNLLEKTATLETSVGDLEALIGVPKDAENNIEASGLYAVIANEIANANYLLGAQIDGSDVTVSQRKALFTSFSSESTVPGLVPVPVINLQENELKSQYFLNAEGNWAIPVDSRIGTLTYNDVTYKDVTSYVDARV
jgi:hypothetical protein